MHRPADHKSSIPSPAVMCRARSTDGVPHVVEDCASGNRALTSSPTSKQHGPIPGPIAANVGRKPAAAISSKRDSTTPCAAPRQPAWATPVAPFATKATPRQSAVNTATGRLAFVVQIPSASPIRPGDSALSMTEPCTCLTIAHSAGIPTTELKTARRDGAPRRSPSPASLKATPALLGGLIIPVRKWGCRGHRRLMNTTHPRMAGSKSAGSVDVGRSRRRSPSPSSLHPDRRPRSHRR